MKLVFDKAITEEERNNIEEFIKEENIEITDEELCFVCEDIAFVSEIKKDEVYIKKVKAI